MNCLRASCPVRERIRCGHLLLGLACLLEIGCEVGVEKNVSRQMRPPAATQPSDTQTAASPGSATSGREATALQIVPQFRNVAAESGIDFVFFSDTVPDRYFLPEVMGGGAAWFDFDCDGSLDLYLMNGNSLDGAAVTDRVNHLYRGTGSGSFQPTPRRNEVADTGYGQGCAAGDFNADGFPDLYLGNYGDNVLLLNNGDGTFSDWTSEAGVSDSLWTSSVLWLDVDGDSLLDLFVTNYLDVTRDDAKACDYSGIPGYCGPGQYNAVPDHVFLNAGDGTFREASEHLGLVGEEGKGLAIVAADFDGDRDVEIYVANDMAPNFLFDHRSSDSDSVSYEDVAVIAGCAQSGEGMNEASMGIACADFDGDQRYDLYLTHYFQMKNTLYRNLGTMLFDDVSLRLGPAGASYEFLGFGTAPLDFDRDGWFDLFITNGHVLGPLNQPHRMSGQLLRNVEGREFADISARAGGYFEQQWLGRGVASADYDSDGDMDLLVTHIDDTPALLRNETEVDGRFLGVDLRSSSRILPVGTRVRVFTGEATLQQMQIAGGSYLCHNDSRILFGWQGADERVDVEIDWPSGATERHEELNVNRYWRLEEGKSPQ